MTESGRYETLLENWDVSLEQNRADFTEWLYEFYGRPNGLYTGLYQRFIKQLSEGLLIDIYSKSPEIFENLKSRLS